MIETAVERERGGGQLLLHKLQQLRAVEATGDRPLIHQTVDDSGAELHGAKGCSRQEES